MSKIIESDWITKAGLRAVVLICLRQDGTKSHRCGYVGVPTGHFLFGVGYSQHVDTLVRYTNDAVVGQKSPITVLCAGVNAPVGHAIAASPENILDVHGGLTFAGGGLTTTYPVESDLWWFGYDCGHYQDGYIEPDRFGGSSYPERTNSFCLQQCEALANQIVELSPI